jgi:uncharacterized membrane protein
MTAPSRLPVGSSRTPPTPSSGSPSDDAFRAQEFLTASLRLASLGTIELRDAVTIVKDPTGKTMVRETIDPQPGMSALSGATWAGCSG